MHAGVQNKMRPLMKLRMMQKQQPEQKIRTQNARLSIIETKQYIACVYSNVKIMYFLSRLNANNGSHQINCTVDASEEMSIDSNRTSSGII